MADTTRPDGIQFFPNSVGPTGGGWQRSSVILDMGDANAVTMEMIPSGPSPQAQIRVLDAIASGGAGMSQSRDAGDYNPATIYNAPNKFNVNGPRRYVTVEVLVTSGTWIVSGAPVLEPSNANITATVSNNVNVGNFPATQPVSLAAAVDVSDRLARLLGQVSLAALTVTISTIEQKVRAGQAFVWSPGRIAAAANEHARLLVQNPNGSGKTVFVYARFLTLDVQAVCVVSLFRSPSVGTPALGAAGAGIANQLLGSGTTSVAQVGADHSATAMAAGTGAALTTEAGVGIGRQAYPAPLYEIPANQSLGIDILVSAAATGVIPELTWWEE